MANEKITLYDADNDILVEGYVSSTEVQRAATLHGLQEFPTEVLIQIFSYPSLKQLCLCREVCVRWQEIIDTLLENEALWEKQCKIDFGELSTNAFNKSRPFASWRRIYRSLTLWPKLSQAIESRADFATTDEQYEMYDFQILRFGKIAVHTQNSIVYYDEDTLQPSETPKITGSYLKFMENEDTILLQSLNFHLFIIRKYVTRKDLQHRITFNDIKIFSLVDRKVYFVTLKDELYVSDLNDSHFCCQKLSDMPDSVMTISIIDNVIYILTTKGYVYTLDKEKMCLVVNVRNDHNPIHLLRKYDFLRHLDQQVHYQWMKYRIFINIRDELSRDITVVKTYGDIVFVGTNLGIFKIYYIKRNEELNFSNKKPLKEYNLKEETDLSVRVQQVDVIEGDDMHTVFVGLENKIAVLYFKHNFN